MVEYTAVSVPLFEGNESVWQDACTLAIDLFNGWTSTGAVRVVLEEKKTIGWDTSCGIRCRIGDGKVSLDEPLAVASLFLGSTYISIFLWRIVIICRVKFALLVNNLLHIKPHNCVHLFGFPAVFTLVAVIHWACEISFRDTTEGGLYYGLMIMVINGCGIWLT